jgi:hypothetical protein
MPLSSQDPSIQQVALELVVTHGFAHAIIDPGKSQEYRQLINGPEADKWIQGCSNKMDRLLLGIDPATNIGTDTIRFIQRNDIPDGKRANYLRIVVVIRPQKEETHRVRFTVVAASLTTRKF